MNTPIDLTKADFTSDQDIRWCPGCGDFAILTQVQTVMSELDIPKENYAVVSGIGCSSRFPYYMNTYGFHTIHGRAPAFATGLKLSNQDLSVWLVTGDGDALSIGGNHFIHLLRRNVNMNVLLFNNEIYGLTKGQYSPTSAKGKVTKSSPVGSVDYPFNPISLALGARATFVARTVDRFPKHTRETLHLAQNHDGTSFIEIFQNCLIFNDGAFEDVSSREGRKENVLYLEHGQPLLFGNEVPKGLVLEGLTLRVVEIGDEYTEADCLVHDASNHTLASLLAQLGPEFPTPVGLFYRSEVETYNDIAHRQITDAVAAKGAGDLSKLLVEKDTWEHN
jgi:2-oxoglutarate ferredoxin oxidoreductase subunit beta